jgi:hypothetical protein
VKAFRARWIRERQREGIALAKKVGVYKTASPCSRQNRSRRSGGGVDDVVGTTVLHKVLACLCREESLTRAAACERNARLRRRILGGFCALCICHGSVLAASSQTFPFKFLQKPGPYPVGLKVVDQYDRSRTYRATDSSRPSAIDEARPLQTLIWYPSLRRPAKPMTVGDYVRLADREIHFNAPDEKENRWRSLLKTSFDIPLSAVRDAQPTKGRYPVLIYAPSDSSVSWENADLCEYLASYGYVVLASPSMGVSTRDMTDDLDGINAQARDISFLITYARSLPDTDLSQVAVVSWSWGGISSLVASARDPRIDALVSMDGSMRYYPGLVKRASNVHPERMAIPPRSAVIGGLAKDQFTKSSSTVARAGFILTRNA